jgi:glucokinase
MEQYASATGIVRLAKKLLKASEEPSTMRQAEELTSKVVFDCAKTGDNLAMRVVDEACYYLGVALAHVAQVIDPQAFIIGGGVSKAGEILIDKIRDNYNKNVMDSLKNKEFKLAILGNDAGIYGCARMILASNR